jgi:hypothetical protein
MGTVGGVILRGLSLNMIRNIPMGISVIMISQRELRLLTVADRFCTVALV